MDRKNLTSAIKSEAQRLGFELAGIAPAVTPGGLHAFLNWLERGYAGEMAYLERRSAAYAHPRHVLDGARSIVVLAKSYHRGHGASRAATEPGDARALPKGRIARYAALDRDYHETIRGLLAKLSHFVAAQQPGARARGIVDTAPLLERDIARQAGLGWFGKNTMLINKRLGSWHFLAALLTDLELEYDQPHDASHCGTCTRCLDACPTGAFVEPWVLDARRCISYLTIEHRSAIDPALREGIGEWLFGCDICQDVCPWNKKAHVASFDLLGQRPDLLETDALQFLTMDGEKFDRRFGGKALARAGREGLARNAAIVLGNAGGPEAYPALEAAARSSDPTVRDAAHWALHCIAEREAACASTA